MSLKPLGDRVIIKRDEVETTTAAGLILTSATKEKPAMGSVIAVGPGRLDKDGNVIPMPLEEGDRVLFGKFAGSEITFQGEELLILRVDEVLAVISE